jgi:glycosyltransferase involved in cell wall biosynthesis
MSLGLPCIAYDCPIGPRAIITNNVDGFLVEDNNVDDFVFRLGSLMENEAKRLEMSKMAKLNVSKYHIDEIMIQWDAFFQSIINSQYKENV